MKRTSLLLVEPYIDYRNFIEEKRKIAQDESLVVHKHHIIPRSFGGNNKKTNIVLLSVEDHFIAHLLFAKCFDDGSYEQIVNLRAARLLNKKSIRDKKTLDAIRNTYIGENNPFYGKTHSDALKKRMSVMNKEKRTGVLYEEFYGEDRAPNEKKKRSSGMKSVWEKRTEDEKKEIGRKISETNTGKTPWNKRRVKVNGIIFDGVPEATEYFSTTKYRLFTYYDVEIMEKT